MFDLVKRMYSFMDEIDLFFPNIPENLFYPYKIKETDSEWIIKIPLPGVTKDDVKITASNKKLYIKVDKKEDFVSDFSFYIPGIGDIKAKLENGLLLITLSKSEDLTSREISID